MSDAIAEARRVLAKLKGSKGWVNTYIADELSEALNNLLSHAERPVDAEVEREAAWLETERHPRNYHIAAMLRSLADKVVRKDEAIAEIRVAYQREQAEWRTELDRREVALAEAIGEIERERKTGAQGVGFNDGLRWCLGILAKVADGGER